MTAIDRAYDAGLRSLREFVAAVAQYQWGYVGAWQLHAWGISQATIDGWVRSGWLKPRFCGAYAVGHVPRSVRSEFMAAVLAVGEDAVLSHISAGRLWRMVKIRQTGIDVTSPRKLRPRPPLVPHWTRRPIATSFCDGIPVTTPEQTILDLAGILYSDRLLLRAMNQGLVDGLLTMDSLVDHLPAARGRRGVRRITDLLHLVTGTRSGLEDEAFRRAIEDGRRPLTNHTIGGMEVDQFDPLTNTVTEIDGARYHDNPIARYLDAEKQESLEALGCTVIRVPERGVSQR